jgi:hypothetical protein
MAIIKANDINKLVDKINQLTKFSRGIRAVKSNPGVEAGGTGQGISWECHQFGGQVRNPVPDDKKQNKYQGGNVVGTHIDANTKVRANQFNEVVNGINNAITEIRGNVTGNDGPGLGDVTAPTQVTKDTIARLQQLQAALNAVSTIESTLNRVNGWVNSANKCNRSCQVNCQVGCQVACNSVNWCHDQKCGGH